MKVEKYENKSWKKNWTKGKVLILIIVLVLSFLLIRLGFGAEIYKFPNQPTMIEGVSIEQTFEHSSHKAIVIDSDLKVNGELKAKNIKSKTTDGLVILGYINLVLMMIILL